MDQDDIPANPRKDLESSAIGEIIARRYSRRAVLRGAGATALALALPLNTRPAQASEPETTRFHFEEIARGTGPSHEVAPGYTADILLRWGDPLFPDAPAYAPAAQTPQAQQKQFGYNNDFIGFLPIKEHEGKTQRGILFVNHEYTFAPLMFPDIPRPSSWGLALQKMTATHCAIERAAHGASLVEIALMDGKWMPQIPSSYNRRITADTPMRLSGPAAGHARLRTKADPSGTSVLGMLNNCAGGMTPWGTFLTGEENFNFYFSGELPKDHGETQNHARYGLPSRMASWGRFEPRFDVTHEPNEPNRFGWIVEVDPLDPSSTPKKRTALGRFKHEGAECVRASDGRMVLYMGDDQRFDYVYKFVTKGRFNEQDMAANRDLLDDGILYVARFNEDGSLDWLPLVHGQGPLTSANDFASQADVLIETRRAADLLGATPMDRPEDISPDAETGRAYVMLTNNSKRKADAVNAANPRAENTTGHIIEINEPEGDFTATRSQWELLVLCGDPHNASSGAKWNPATSRNGWFGSPDNSVIDPAGRLWIATDGNDGTGASDGLWALETKGALRGTGRAFFRAPDGAEVCGPCFTPDGETLFLAVQHPGDGEGADYANPATRWPDFEPGLPPRPSVMVIRRSKGGKIADG